MNWTVGSLLILWAGSGIVFQIWREATDPVARLWLNNVGDMYEASNYLLVLLIIDRLILRSPRPRAWTALLAVGAAALPLFWWFQATTTLDRPYVGMNVLNVALGYAAQNVLIVLGARAAGDPGRSLLQRRQAALFALAFGLLIAHSSAAGTVDILLNGIKTDVQGVLHLFILVGLAAAAYALVKVPTPFHGAGRLAIRISLVLAVVVALGSWGLIPFSQYGGRVVALSAFALVLAVAVLRYDIAAVGPQGPQRLQKVATLLLGLCIAAVLGVGAWSLSGQGALALVVGLAALVVPAAILVTPLKRLPAWITRRVLLGPRDPEALRERVRVYASTLRAATRPDGTLSPGAEPALAALRTQLGLAQRDHDLLVAMGRDQSAGGIVAYRLALVGAAADAEVLAEPQLQALREELGVSERDHALVLEHVSASSDRLDPGALFLGRYHIQRRLGEGGLGEVWLANDTRTKTEVAVKHLTGHDRRDAAALQRLRRSAHVSALDHPHIVAVREVETVGDETYLVMEHMGGGSLADVLRARGQLPEDEVVRIASDILDALGALHARGIVHRDVKPANILLDEKGIAKLGDFNIARELVSGDTIGGEGARGPVGTFAYMPLEQARGLASRVQSDLYGLAATMYEALAGAPMLHVEGLSHTEAIARLAEQATPSRVPNASPALSAAIVKALARLPENRFGSADEMRAAITPPGTREGSGRRR